MRAAFWKVVNLVVRPLAGHAPWWLLLETTGRRTGRLRRTPLVSGPIDAGTLCVLSVHGEDAAYVKNLRADPAVRVKRRGRWLDGAAEVVEPTPEAIAGLGRYARWVLLRMASEPRIVKVTVR